MRNLKQILFAAVVTICFSMTALAQKDDNKKPPPKKDPPVIVVAPKDKPKDDKKKPEAFVLYFKDEQISSTKSILEIKAIYA